MEDAPMLLETLKDLKQADLEEFIWHLCIGVAKDIKCIPKRALEGADCKDVVLCMVNQFDTDAGKITVQVLRKMKQNHLANCLEPKLREGQQSAQQDTRSAPVESQPSQSDGRRHNMTPSSQEFKRNTLQEMGDEIYRPATSQKKGSALLITNIVFEYSEYNRYGADIDEENMEWLLTALGYNVVKRRNLSGEEIDEEVRNFSKLLRKDRDSDSTFVVIMSHGARIDNRDVILGVHYHKSRNPEDVYFVDKTFSHLNSVNCPSLIDKPKVILIQACRGDHPGGVEVRDQVPESDSWFHREIDFACFMSTLPVDPHIEDNTILTTQMGDEASLANTKKNTVSYRNPVTGSRFINYIVEVFCKWAHEHDIMELFRKVTKCMATCPGRTEKKLLPCLERTSLTKKFYLFPGI